MKAEHKMKLKELAKILDRVAGLPEGSIEITIRAEGEFTFTFDGRNERAIKKLEDYLSRCRAKTSSVYDPETGVSAVYADA